MCRPRILKALLPKRTASVNQLFSSFKNHLQVADVRFKSAFMYPMMHRFILWVRFLRKIKPPPPLPAKTIPISAAHTYMAYIWEYPLPRGNEVLLKSFKSIMDWAQNKRQLGRNSKWKINAIVTDLHKQRLMYFGHKREGGAWKRSSWREKIDGKRERGRLRRQWERKGTYRYGMFSTCHWQKLEDCTC